MTFMAGSVSFLATAAPINVQALWWASPPGSESGWGLNITHQGDTLFATWFTYDTDGSPMWLVASDVRRVTGDFYSGALYRTTGPPFDSVPFSPAGIGMTQVGVVEFSFTDVNNGTFSYSVNGIDQAKAITRQIYDKVSTCTAGGVAAAAPNFQDLWWSDPAGGESGWGVNITHQGDILFATWFTYDASGKGMWVVMSAGRYYPGTGTYVGKLYRTTGAPFNANPWNPALTVVTEVGIGSFDFNDANTGSFYYYMDDVTQTKLITRQVYALPATVCN